MDEAQTRKLLVDKALRDTGWSPIVKFAKGAKYDNCVVTEYETSTGPADYVLFHNREPIAAVESKRLSIGPQNVLSQAQRYSRGFENGPFDFGGYHIPFVYSTNGEIFWFQDLREPNSRSRQIAKFHTPNGLRELLEFNWSKANAWLEEHPNQNEYLRDYQKDAIHVTEEALRSGKRKMLIAMATGTGKTVVAISLIYRLLKSGAARKILFLVDRRALAAQAVGAFSNFEPEPGLKFDKLYEVYSQPFRRDDLEEYKFNPKRIPQKYLENPQSNLAYVYICTIQRMRIYLFGKEGMFNEVPGESEIDDVDKIPIPISAFDVVIADECHRGYTSTEEGKWRQVLDHFDAIKIGLTATPAAHTKAYFQDIVYRYNYEQAVAKGYLVDYEAVKIESDITMKGLFLHPGEEVGLIDTATGRETFDILEDERAYDTTDLEQKATAPNRNKKIVKEFAKHALQQERDLGRFPRTLVFAINDISHISHADQLLKMLREEFSTRGDSFVTKITGSPSVDQPLKRIREFRNRPQPSIAITVDMLTTGVDIPRLENLVFIRPVKSRILFAQMLGRGTRTCEEINKTHFTVFDCFGGTLLEYFRDTTDFTADPPASPKRSIRIIIDDIYNNKDGDYNTRVLVKRLMRIDKNISAEGREMLTPFIPQGDIQSFAQALPNKIEHERAETMRLLRNPALQNLLENYPRAAMTFVVADTEDQVRSEYVFRTTDGRNLKPADYLIAFESFVIDNPDHIEALAILMQKPAQFKIRELRELRNTLAQRPERFTEDNLRKVYRNNLADIISIIHHAIKSEPLITAEERVDRAMRIAKRGKNFTPEQSQWLQYIRDHLVNNLVIEEQDFRQVPFSRHGGWEKASQVFKGQLSPLLEEIDMAMVSL